MGKKIILKRSQREHLRDKLKAIRPDPVLKKIATMIKNESGNHLKRQRARYYQETGK